MASLRGLALGGGALWGRRGREFITSWMEFGASLADPECEYSLVEAEILPLFGTLFDKAGSQWVVSTLTWRLLLQDTDRALQAAIGPGSGRI
jgi:hypothetical protein